MSTLLYISEGLKSVKSNKKLLMQFNQSAILFQLIGLLLDSINSLSAELFQQSLMVESKII